MTGRKKKLDGRREELHKDRRSGELQSLRNSDLESQMLLKNSVHELKTLSVNQ